MRPNMSFTELREVFMEHLRRVWHASRERLPFQTTGSVPFFGTCVCSNCCDQIFRTCCVLTLLFTFNTPRYFLDFSFFIPITSDECHAYRHFMGFDVSSDTSEIHEMKIYVSTAIRTCNLALRSSQLSESHRIDTEHEICPKLYLTVETK